jgi:hypothetical protein
MNQLFSSATTPLRDEYIPISEPPYAFCQITPSLEFGIDDCADVDLGEAMADEGPEVLWEPSKRIVTSLRHVCQHGAVDSKWEVTLNPWIKHNKSVFFMADLGVDE